MDVRKIAWKEKALKEKKSIQPVFSTSPTQEKVKTAFKNADSS